VQTNSVSRRRYCRTPYRAFDTVYGMIVETAPPTGATAPRDRLGAVAGVVVLGAFLTILDTTVVNVAIATLGRELGASLATVQWVATGYLLALAATIPVTGWAADRFGAKRLFAAALALFTAGSALAAAAWSAEALIAARVVQGIGGGAVLPAGIMLIGITAGPERMGRAMSVVGIPMLLAPALGPVLGGLLLDVVSWRWLFLVNLPVGAIALLLAIRLLPATAPPRPTQRLDLRGLALLSPGMALLVFGLSETAASGVGSASALVPALTGLLLVALFAAHALRGAPSPDATASDAVPSDAVPSDAVPSDAVPSDATPTGTVPSDATPSAEADARPEPLLDLRLLRIPSVAASAATLLLLGGAFLGALFLLPLYLQQARGESPLDTGLLLLGQGLSAAAAMHLAGRAAERFGAGRVVVAGLVPFALGLAGLTQLDAETSYVALEAALVLYGVGMGATMMPAMTAAYRTLARPQVARATALLQIVQRLGSSLGVALVAVALQRAGDDGATAAAGPDALAGAFRWPLLLALLATIPAILLARDARRAR
jgi:MFS family permease